MKTSKKFLALALALVMIFSMMSMSAVAAEYGNVTLAIPDGEGLTLSPLTQTATNTWTCNVVPNIAGYAPFSFSLNVVPDAGVTATVTGQNGAVVTQEGTLSGNATYWLVIPSTTQASSVKITAGSNTYYINCAIPHGAPSAGAGAYAYLPAPGQFTNEGTNTGGWGDIFNSGSASLKGMVNAISSTGVSLGYFGGYAVFDMGENIQNTSTNPYGVDFIVYGNAFKNNSEPGCIQVAPDANNDGVPDAWYDIAGSLHYASQTEWNASYTYTNPFPADDVTSIYPTAGTWNSTLANNNVPFTFTPGNGSGSVIANNFHRHAWFPLYANYFVNRGSIGEMAKTGSFPFASYTRDVVNGSKLTLTGVKLGSADNIRTENYTFGYADVHPNGSSYGVAANPYAATADTVGGDGIDISWAVNSNGEPVNLSSIRFVRVYTGAAYMNGMFGEISTEVCGVYKATGTGSGAAVAPNVDVMVGGMDLATLQAFGVTVTTTVVSNTQKIITISGLGAFGTQATVSASGGTNLLINGVATSSTSAAIGSKVQIINQSGTAEGYITLLKLQA